MDFVQLLLTSFIWIRIAVRFTYSVDAGVRIKALLWEADGFVLLYKRLSVEGKYRWPRDKSEVRPLTWQQFDWLMSGLEIEQPKAIGAHKKEDNLSPTLEACSQGQKALQSLENTAFFTVNKAPDLV